MAPETRSGSKKRVRLESDVPDGVLPPRRSCRLKQSLSEKNGYQTPSTDVDEKSVRNVEECGICLEPVKFRGLLNSCAHSFCYECILQWSQTENSCPFCKARFHSLTREEVHEKEQAALSECGRKSKGKIKIPQRNQQSQRHDGDERTLFFDPRDMSILFGTDPEFPDDEDLWYANFPQFRRWS
mmetsp:Transcript_14280/g.24386  ORF Transcript_14280/g.24386 Transcript_14280/m.24386 type:complete len:184 (+) Transcript_14280:41-592(+)